MESIRLSLVTLGFIVILLAPVESWALPQDDCTSDAVPRTTPSNHFTVIGDGSIVRHETTRLEWQRCALGQSWDGSTCIVVTPGRRRWENTLMFVAGVDDGWRLPNLKELLSIVEGCRTSPSINQVVFPNAPSSYFWSASPNSGGSGLYAWAVDFALGGDFLASKSSTYRARLVRDGQ